MTDHATLAPGDPSFAEMVCAVDVPALAKRIQQQGSRAAIQASTIEILAMAVQLNDLNPIVEKVFTLFATADVLQATRDPQARAPLKAEVSELIFEIADALTALGYPKPTTTNQEKTNV